MDKPVRTIDDEAKDLVKDRFPIALDFDGTVVEHRYPFIGDELPHCVKTLKKWNDMGVGIILDTMRDGEELKAAVQWFEERSIELYGVGANPTQHTWTKSPKAYGVFSIDDRNLGAPVKLDSSGRRNCIDWEEVDKRFTELIAKYAEQYIAKHRRKTSL